ncbi:1-deoxy-D-xylulose-5-phosphate synthase [[Clostridium] polysaccharolyticum]|uniref:1-deoxy-D-xylulose-5-phosphate synthase n=1 Tax=[Clostridium] polysaccharolyticum TaxID=29364 RepID=A0A1I0DGX8_9FIRM|nr:1-deoxy-D-xylulose-5-phosphate synthase [[Clostridium] polysaccharolyticum]SET30903.1 1-deoxy-D-xylulose-5-phosphate synthase [[Clostridium] polysaccharolyticum]
MILEKINSPEDIKVLSMEQLKILSDEVRTTLLSKLSNHGGHIGPNLGMVEMTVALHYVFQSPADKIVYDVSHQSYTHKMLTGRKDAFLNPDHYEDVTGYTNPEESPHDFFNIGHTSTSVSLACGLAKGRDLTGGTENIIAIIGDGSLSGGEAYEGLNNLAEAGTGTIVIVNDNDMSIAENHGGLYQNLRALRESEGKCECNFFKALGFDYRFVKDGHDLKELIDVFQEVKDTTKPVVVHIHTIKGKGFAPAENDKEQWHWNFPFEMPSGQSKMHFGDGESYEDLTAEYLLKKMKEDEKVVVISSGTPGVIGFHKARRDEAGKQFVDVGIAEEHAVALASGISKRGGTPVYGVVSSFLQRTYDQVSQDLCINNNPVTFLVFGGSVFGMSDVTHLGLFDIAMLGNIPNLVYLSPTCKEEYFAMLKWSMTQREHPVAIRVPANGVISTGIEDTTDYSSLNKYQVTRTGKDVVVIAAGSFYQMGQQIAEQVDGTLINPKFVSGIDEELLKGLEKDYKLVIVLEDGIIEGGYGQKIASFLGTYDIKVKNYGIRKSFPDCYVVEELLKENGISVEQVVEDIRSLVKQKR